MDRLLAAIMTGKLSQREARVMLAFAVGQAWSAGSAARATGVDRAHCTRAIAALTDTGWLTRDATGRSVVPVDNPAGVVPKQHLPVPKEHQGRGAESAPPSPESGAERAPPSQAGGADSAPPPVPKEHHTPAPVVASGGVMPNEHQPRVRACGGGYLYTTTTTHSPPDAHCKGGEGVPPSEPGSPPEQLVFPRAFTPELQALALRLLAGVNGQAQALLDEVAGRASIQPIKNPLAYLRGLVGRAKAGDFTPEAGVAVAMARRRAEAMQRARKETEDAHLAELKRSAPPGGSLKATLEALRRSAAPS